MTKRLATRRTTVTIAWSSMGFGLPNVSVKTRQAKGGSGGSHDLQPTPEAVEAAVEATDNHYTTWKYSSDVRMLQTMPL